jgi:hypothetical protein
MTNTTTELRLSFDEVKRTAVIRGFWSVLIVSCVTTGLFAWKFGLGPAVGAFIASAMLTLFAAAYAWDSTERQYALDSTPKLDETLAAFYRALNHVGDEEGRISPEMFLKWREKYYDSHDGVVEILRYIRTQRELPGIHQLPTGTPKHILDDLRSQAMAIAS